MKLTRSQLKQIIMETLNEHEAAAQTIPQKGYNDYRRSSGTGDQITSLLEEIVSQLKMLNHTMTPSQVRSSSELEKAIAQTAVAEEKESENN